MDNYLGVQLVKAKAMTRGEYNIFRKWTLPEDEDGSDKGYLLSDKDEYVRWIPEDIFNKTFLKLDEDGSSISEEVVNKFAGTVEKAQIDNKTTIVKSEMINGFVQYETSSCVDPANYDQETGEDIAYSKIQNSIWNHLGFVLQWGTYGINQTI